MNPTEIADALDAIAKAEFDPNEFGYSFAQATDNAQATVAKLKAGTTNKSDIPGGVLLNAKFHYAPALPGMAAEMLDALRASKRTAKAKPAILVATNGEMIAAEHPKSGETLHCSFADLGTHFSFFLPAAGKERYRAAEENPVDIKATGKLAKLYDALLKANPDWAKPERRHAMNLFMTRLIFCLFSEDVGVFKEDQFSFAVFSFSGNKGEHARETLVQAFAAMNLPQGQRDGLPAWTEKFEYVNGGLFADAIEAPEFDPISFRYLRDAAELDWKLINPDIFGSMIQSIADPKARAELGMHYTSVPNIMKVLGPLFLDDLDEALEKAWDKPAALKAQLHRLSKIRVFDPACGSGNFLVVAYRQMREREIRILKRLGELEGNEHFAMFSSVSLNQFYGIELTDFAAETAKLALFIAEYQANARFADVFGRMPALLPLRDGGQITCGNALRLDWSAICPRPIGGEELFVAGNPPYLGAKKREEWQTEDMCYCGLSDLLLLDYVAAWFFKASEYSAENVQFSFVATSSICQGEQVAPLWSKLLTNGLRIKFAYRPFEWSNSAADNAGVWVTIVGLSWRKLQQSQLFEGDIVNFGNEISPYLLVDKFVPVKAESCPLFPLPDMVMGSNPVDGKWLSVSDSEREDIIDAYPDADQFIRPYLGGNELLEEVSRYCLWIGDENLTTALHIPPISRKIDGCRTYRQTAGRDARKVAHVPHRFCYSTYSDAVALAVPNSQSSDRQFVPCVMVPAGVILSKEAFAIYNPPGHTLALISSEMHRLWLSTVGGRIGNGFRYSVKLVYNTFPIPKFTSDQVEQLSASGRRILKTRYQHYPKPVSELYDPAKMPDDLRAVHRENDELLEGMYIGRPFRNDTERLEKLFKLYAARMKQGVK